jgi:hypothetical protein
VVRDGDLRQLLDIGRIHLAPLQTNDSCYVPQPTERLREHAEQQAVRGVSGGYVTHNSTGDPKYSANPRDENRDTPLDPTTIGRANVGVAS